MEDLSKCTMPEGGKETMAHATSISTGGEPIFLMAQESETLTFDKTGLTLKHVHALRADGGEQVIQDLGGIDIMRNQVIHLAVGEIGLFLS